MCCFQLIANGNYLLRALTCCLMLNIHFLTFLCPNNLNAQSEREQISNLVASGRDFFLQYKERRIECRYQIENPNGAQHRASRNFPIGEVEGPIFADNEILFESWIDANLSRNLFMAIPDMDGKVRVTDLGDKRVHHFGRSMEYNLKADGRWVLATGVICRDIEKEKNNAGHARVATQGLVGGFFWQKQRLGLPTFFLPTCFFVWDGETYLDLLDSEFWKTDNWNLENPSTICKKIGKNGRFAIAYETKDGFPGVKSVEISCMTDSPPATENEDVTETIERWTFVPDINNKLSKIEFESAGDKTDGRQHKHTLSVRVSDFKSKEPSLGLQRTDVLQGK